MSEWFKELVLKTSDTATYRGFESHPVRHIFYIYRFADLPKWWRGSPAKGVGLETGARVQISQSAPSIKSHKSRNCVACELFYFSPPAFWSLFGHYGFENCISESKRAGFNACSLCLLYICNQAFNKQPNACTKARFEIIPFRSAQYIT